MIPKGQEEPKVLEEIPSNDLNSFTNKFSSGEVLN